MNEKEKLLWNEAVKATVNQIRLYDGIITDRNDREFLCEDIYKRVAYKKPKKIIKQIINQLNG